MFVVMSCFVVGFIYIICKLLFNNIIVVVR